MKYHSLLSYLPCLLLGLGLLAGCEPPREPRVYNAPKEDTVFVVQPPAVQPPMMGGMPAMSGGASIAAADKRILGAIFPIDGAGCFLKITDTIDRIDQIEVPLQKIVSEFKLGADGKPDVGLPEGWTVGAGDSIALAKISIPVPGGKPPVIMTVTILNAPDLSDSATAEATWNQYVLEQMNRWNGQVSHDSQTLPDLLASLTSVEREGSPVLAYIFDKDGSHTRSEASAETAAAGEPKGEADSAEKAPALPDVPVSGSETSSSSSPAAVPPSAGPLPADAQMPQDANHAGLHSSPFDPAKLQYETPEGWEIQPPRTFRLATFKIPGVDGDRDGEVVLSLALDNPTENSKMWAEQVLKTDDPSILEPKAASIVQAGEPIAAGELAGKLYRIQGDDDPAATVLEVAVIPMPNMETSMFIKLNSSQRMAEQQKENLRRFVNSLRWE